MVLISFSNSFFVKMINKYVKQKGTEFSMTYSVLSAASIWTPGQTNPGVDLCLEGVRD